METTHESSKQTLRSAQPAKPYACLLYTSDAADE